jgi:probable HAF family extracellular repeat protein
MVAGSMYAGQISIEIPKYSAVVYSNDVSHTVPEFGSGSMFALGINNKGEVVGGGDGSSGRDPFLWRNGQRFDLNDLVDLDVDLEFARVITETGVIYATSYLYGSGAALYKLTPTDAGRYAAVELFRTNRVLHFSVNSSGYVADGGSLWADTTLIPLGDLGTERVYAQSVNSSKEVVGYAQPKDDPSYHGFLWNGKMLDLKDLVEAPGWLIHTASSINEYGQIAAMGWNGHFHAAMRLTPNPQTKMAISRTGWPVASVRPGSRRPVVLMASSNLVEWSRLARHERP